MHRHSHRGSFTAVVLAGEYVEAGDTGRHSVSAGDVIVHRVYERHLNRIARSGAEVIVVPFHDQWNAPSLGRIDDPDEVVRIAERSPVEAADYVASNLKPRATAHKDWPDLLAAALIAEPVLAIGEWARLHSLHPGSLSRGFERQFETTPAVFRATARAHCAIRRIVTSEASLASIAVECGYADQAHMSRGVRAVTGRSPIFLRR